MPHMTGQYSGKVTVNSSLELDDAPGHQGSLMEVRGLQTVSDENGKDSKMTYWGTGDFIRGTGMQHGYFITEHPDGDRDCGIFEGKIAVTNGQVTIEGTWKFTHGTGRFEGISGGGTFKGRMISVTETEMRWEGLYKLAKSRAA